MKFTDPTEALEYCKSHTSAKLVDVDGRHVCTVSLGWRPDPPADTETARRVARQVLRLGMSLEFDDQDVLKILATEVLK